VCLTEAFSAADSAVAATALAASLAMEAIDTE